MNNLKIIIIMFFVWSNMVGQTKLIEQLENGYLILEKNMNFFISKDTSDLSFKFDTICKSKFNEYLYTRVDKLWGIVNQNGKIVVPNLYENINSACCYENLNNENNFIVRKDKKVGVINYNNQIIIPIIYDKITNWVEYGPKAHYVCKDNKIGLIKHNGKIMIPVIYDSLYYENDGIIKGKIKNKFGILNSQNKIIIPFEYDTLIIDFDFFRDFEGHVDKFVVKKNNIWYFLDYKGNIIDKNIPEEEIKKKFTDLEINNNDLNYIGKSLSGNTINYFY